MHKHDKQGVLIAITQSTRAAIDLASIMVGVIVIGIIGGIIAATVFSVIPWAQDNATKSSMDSVTTAQSAYIALNGGKSYGSEKQLGGENDAVGNPAHPTVPAEVAASKLFSDPDNLITITLNATGTVYTVTATSPTGKVFTATNGSKAVAVPVMTNILADADGENGSTAAWGGSSTMAVVTDGTSYAGSSHIVTVSPTSPQQTVAVVAGETFSFKMWVKRPGIGNGIGQSYNLIFTDANGAQVGSILTETLPTATNWIERTRDGVVPAGATQVTVKFPTSGLNQRSLDNVSFTVLR